MRHVFNGLSALGWFWAALTLSGLASPSTFGLPAWWMQASGVMACIFVAMDCLGLGRKATI